MKLSGTIFFLVFWGQILAIRTLKVGFPYKINWTTSDKVLMGFLQRFSISDSLNLEDSQEVRRTMEERIFRLLHLFNQKTQAACTAVEYGDYSRLVLFYLLIW